MADVVRIVGVQPSACCPCGTPPLALLQQHLKRAKEDLHRAIVRGDAPEVVASMVAKVERCVTPGPVDPGPWQGRACTLGTCAWWCVPHVEVDAYHYGSSRRAQQAFEAMMHVRTMEHEMIMRILDGTIRRR